MEDDILRFQIAMDDLALMHVVQGTADLLHDHPGQLLWKFALAL